MTDLVRSTGRRPGPPAWIPSLTLLAALASSAAACRARPADLAGGGRQPEATGISAPGGLLERLSARLDRATATEAPSLTPSPTPSPSPTSGPTSTPPHPLDIALLRSRAFAPGPLTLETELGPGPGYSRQVVGYTSDGLKIYALLTVPDGPPPDAGWPAVVFNHGYIPPAQYRTTERYVAYVDAFARAGYVVLKSDYRGHGDSEGRAEGAYGSPAYTIDVLHALAALRADPRVDPERIGMWGHSMGGQITLRSMVVTDTIRAGVIWAGVVADYDDLLTRWRRPAAAGSAASPAAGSGATAATPTGTPRPGSWRSMASLYGSPDESPEFWAAISPNHFLADLSGPLQLHHGTADTSVPVVFSELLLAEVAAAGREAELFTYPGDDHNIAAGFGTAMRRSVEFMNQHVSGRAP